MRRKDQQQLYTPNGGKRDIILVRKHSPLREQGVGLRPSAILPSNTGFVLLPVSRCPCSRSGLCFPWVDGQANCLKISRAELIIPAWPERSNPLQVRQGFVYQQNHGLIGSRIILLVVILRLFHYEKSVVNSGSSASLARFSR